MQYELGFVGGGNMTQAIALGAVKAGVIDASKIIVSNPSQDKMQVLRDVGIVTTADNGEVIAAAEQIVIAVKPQMFEKVVDDFKKYDVKKQVLISIMAGLSSAKIAEAIGCNKARIVRVMPNTPTMVGAGMAGIAAGAFAGEGDLDLCVKIFNAAGEAVVIEEGQMDGLTPLSGSGPAYVFLLAEAMEKAAVELGVGEFGEQLVRQTILGAAMLLNSSEDSAAVLRQKVTSKGGVTLAATSYMEDAGMIDIVIEALKQAKARSIEMGQG